MMMQQSGITIDKQIDKEHHNNDEMRDLHKELI